VVALIADVELLLSSEAEGTIAGPFGQKIVISPGGRSPN
jgi:hypothetical protein